jgi:hypothetical protein
VIVKSITPEILEIRRVIQVTVPTVEIIRDRALFSKGPENRALSLITETGMNNCLDNLSGSYYRTTNGRNAGWF